MEARKHHLLTRRFAAKCQNTGISRAGNASELWVGCGRSETGEDLQQTVCSANGRLRDPPESTDQHQTQIGLKMERDSSELLIGVQDILQKASSFEKDLILIAFSLLFSNPPLLGKGELPLTSHLDH